MVIWLLLIYAIGFFITLKTMEDSLDLNDDPWAALMWPILVLVLFWAWVMHD
jgi:hypothetical protein